MGRLRKTVRERIDRYSPHQRSRSPFPMNDLTEEAVPLYASELKELGVEVMFDFSEPSPRVWGIPDQLQQVFLHLLSSAVAAMPWGGEIDFNTQLQKEHIACMIRDSGDGITEDQCENVFDPFFNTKENRHRLGLTVCDHITTRHQGEIVLLESDEEGTCFQVTFPRGG